MKSISGLPKFLRRRVEQAFGIVEQGLASIPNPYVSCSWGKDSTIVLWLVMEVAPRTPVVWMNSGYQFPDTYEFRDRILEEWHIHDYREIEFPVDQLEKVRKIGLEDITLDVRDSPGKKQKGNKFDDWAQSQGFNGSFWGMRADESIARRKLFRVHGPVYRKRDGLWRCAPICWWDFQTMWSIAEMLEIPHNTIYDKTMFESPQWIRSSGYLTTVGAGEGKIVWMKHYYPELYNQLCRDFPEIAEYA